MNLLKVYLPYRESDHVLNIAYNALCEGRTLEDIELRRNDETFLDALGAERIPDPTTAGDFCRRFDLANHLAPARCVITPASGHLGDYYGAFDSFCLPSESEGFGLATLEALFCGVPVITTDSGFAPELLHDRVHYVQCAGNADSIADSIGLLASHRQRAAGLAAEGRSAAEQFGFATRMCGEYEALLLGLRIAEENRAAEQNRAAAEKPGAAAVN